MKRLIYILSVACLALIAGCRTNNGDIGPLYGEWALDAMTLDGDPAGVDCDRYYFRFQNNILQITTLGDYNDFVNTLGTWTRDGDSMTLDFTHSTADGDAGFNPPPALLLPARGVAHLRVVTLTGTNMVLEYQAPVGIVVYTLRKLR